MSSIYKFGYRGWALSNADITFWQTFPKHLHIVYLPGRWQHQRSPKRWIIFNIRRSSSSKVEFIHFLYFICSLESMRRHGELGWLFHHAMPSMATDTSSSILPKVQIQEVLPVLVIIAASLVVANAFLVMERCIHRLVYRYRHRQRLCQCDTRFVNSACKTIK